MALSPVDGRRAPGNCRTLQISCWTFTSSSERGSDPAAPKVHRQSIQNHRHKDGAPVSINGQRPGAKAPERPKYGPTGGGPAGPRMFGGPPAIEKCLHFLPSFKRLLGHLGPERGVLAAVVALAVIGIALNVLGPRVLGRETRRAAGRG